MTLPLGFPISTCQRSGEWDFLPWLSWRATRTSNMIRRGSNPVRMRWGTACRGLIQAQGQNVGGDDDQTLWRLIPTATEINGMMMFRLFNKARGEVTSGEYRDSGGFGTEYITPGVGGSVTIHGVLLSGVTRNNSDFWIVRNGESVQYDLYWVASWFDGRDRKNEPHIANYYQKSECNSIYRAGFQLPSDVNDQSRAYFVPSDYSSNHDLYYPNPYAGIGTTGDRIGQCIVTNCDGLLGTSQPCRDFITQNPGTQTTLQMLDPYCSADPDRALNDPLCGVWCSQGLSGNTAIRDKCLSQRRRACSKYYDPVTGTWTGEASEEVRSRCSCYMPDGFYTALLNSTGTTVPPGATPNCFYQGCADSAIGRQSFTPDTCGSVTVCIQSDGRVTRVNCVDSSGQPGEPPVVPPVTPPVQPPPGGVPPVVQDPEAPVSGLAWGWIILGIVAFIVLIVIVVVILSRKPAPTNTTTSLLIPLLLAENAKRTRR